jgi:hypothetical protein
MKKMLISILWIALYLNPLQAQIKKGSWMIGGSGALRQSRFLDRTGKFSSFFKAESLFLNPELGYFVTNHWMIGVSASMSLTQNTFMGINPQEITYESYTLEPFTRLYITPKRRFKLFYEGSIGGSVSKQKGVFNAPDSVRRQTGFSIGNAIGADYFLTDNIAIEGFMNYNFYNRLNLGNSIVETAFPKFIINPTFRMRLFLNTKGETMESTQKYFEKGNWTCGIRMNFALTEGDKFQISTFTPHIGYFVMDNLMIGSEFSLYYEQNLILGMHLMPEVRYYQPIARLTHGFVSMRLLSMYSKHDALGFMSKFRRQEWAMGLGINRFIAPNITVLSALNVAISKSSFDTGFEFIPQLRIGFQYFMSKK